MLQVSCQTAKPQSLANGDKPQEALMLPQNKFYFKNSSFQYDHGDEFQLNYLKGSIHDLFKRCNIFMGINLCKVLIKYLKGSILDLDKCYLCLSDDFYFSSIYTERPRTKHFLIVYQEGGVGGKRIRREQKEVERICTLSTETLFIRINLPY